MPEPEPGPRGHPPAAPTRRLGLWVRRRESWRPVWGNISAGSGMRNTGVGGAELHRLLVSQHFPFLGEPVSTYLFIPKSW